MSVREQGNESTVSVSGSAVSVSGSAVSVRELLGESTVSVQVHCLLDCTSPSLVWLGLLRFSHSDLGVYGGGV